MISARWYQMGEKLVEHFETMTPSNRMGMKNYRERTSDTMLSVQLYSPITRQTIGMLKARSVLREE